MFWNLINALFGDSQNSRSNRQTVASVVSKESATENMEFMELSATEKSLDEEILLLARTYGPLANGVRIELGLQEALRLFPRKRRRSDAFGKLIKKVHDEYGTELIITSKKKGIT